MLGEIESNLLPDAVKSCLTLKQDKIERRRGVPPGDRGQEAMCLPAMMRLMIEEMIERGREFLRNGRGPGDGAVAEFARERCSVEPIAIARNAQIFRTPRLAQFL